MKLELESIAPIALIGLLAVTLYFNNSAPSVTPNGYSVLKPKPDIELIRGVDDVREEDNKVTISHTDRPDDKLDFRLWHNYIVFPRDKDGEPIVPKRKNPDGSESPLWEIKVTRKEYIFDPGWDFGAYGGYLGGNKDKTDIQDIDVGLRFSPVRIWNTFALDGLISNQSTGVGLSFYPAPERFGEVWSNLGVGYGRVITFDDDEQRNLFYFAFSTRF